MAFASGTLDKIDELLSRADQVLQGLPGLSRPAVGRPWGAGPQYGGMDTDYGRPSYESRMDYGRQLAYGAASDMRMDVGMDSYSSLPSRDYGRPPATHYPPERDYGRPPLEVRKRPYALLNETPGAHNTTMGPFRTPAVPLSKLENFGPPRPSPFGPPPPMASPPKPKPLLSAAPARAIMEEPVMFLLKV